MSTSDESKGKEVDMEKGEISPTIGSMDDKSIRRPSEPGHRILFAPDPRERRGTRTDDMVGLQLSRTFSRQSRFSSYSAVSDDDERIKRVTTRKTVEPRTRLPTSTFAILLYTCTNR
jgi:hypothetical protein